MHYISSQRRKTTTIYGAVCASDISLQLPQANKKQLENESLREFQLRKIRFGLDFLVGTRDEVVLVRDEAGCNYIMVSYRRMLLFFLICWLIFNQPVWLEGKGTLKEEFFGAWQEPEGKQQRGKEAPRGIKKREEQMVKTENEPNDILKPSLGGCWTGKISIPVTWMF